MLPTLSTLGPSIKEQMACWPLKRESGSSSSVTRYSQKAKDASMSLASRVTKPSSRRLILQASLLISPICTSRTSLGSIPAWRILIRWAARSFILLCQRSIWSTDLGRSPTWARGSTMNGKRIGRREPPHGFSTTSRRTELQGVPSGTISQSAAVTLTLLSMGFKHFEAW